MEKIETNQVVGLVPAGGYAKRIGPLPCSKELFPIGFKQVNGISEARPKVACHYLLERMRIAGVKKAYIILREGKWDIPTYFGDGTALVNMHLAYLMMNIPYGAPFTINQAYPFIKDDLIVFGFPDIIFRPIDAYKKLLNCQAKTGADIVLALFPVDQPNKMDMVKLDRDDKICDIIIKPKKSNLKYTWVIAVWTPAFSRFMHNYLYRIQIDNQSNHSNDLPMDRELFVGDVISAAIREDLHIEPVFFSQGGYIDIGTPEDLVRAVKQEAFALNQA